MASKDSRYPIDDFVIQYYSKLTRRDFIEIRRPFGKGNQRRISTISREMTVSRLYVSIFRAKPRVRMGERTGN
jgi:hypothetical protein